MRESSAPDRRSMRPTQLGVERAQVLVERVDEDPVGEVLLELGGASGEDEPLPLLAAERQLGQQPGLADARLPGDLEHGVPARLDAVEGALDERQLRRPPHDPLRLVRHP